MLGKNLLTSPIELRKSDSRIDTDFLFQTQADEDDIFIGGLKRAYSTSFPEGGFFQKCFPVSPSKKTQIKPSFEIEEDYYMKKAQSKAPSLSTELYEDREKTDFKCNLPTLKNNDFFDLNIISHGQLSDLISQGKCIEIIDCRFPYEFNCGSIKNAINIYEPNSLITRLFGKMENIKRYLSSKCSIVLHCEYGKLRSPKLLRFLRSIDRQIHSEVYPRILFSEIYLLSGGYKEFYKEHQVCCLPRIYAMVDIFR